MKLRKVVVLSAIAMAYGCGGNNNSSTPEDAGGDGTTDSPSTQEGGGEMDATTEGGGDTGASMDGAAEAAPARASSRESGTDGGAEGAAGDAGPDASDASIEGGGSAGDASTDAASDGPASDGNVACDAAAGGTYYVDPVNGSDAVTSTGSDMAGGATRATCAFKTITHALSVVGAPTTATTIVVLGPATVSAGETFPLVVPQNVVIKGQGGAVTVDVPATQPTDGGTAPADGFVLMYPASGLESLTIDGQSLAGAAGVLVGTGSASSTYLKNVTAQNFTAGAGVAVSGSGVVTLDEGVVLTKNLDGLVLSGTASASSSNTNQASPVAFTQNTQDGVLVQGSASISFVGAAGAMGAGSILASQNATGLVMMQAGPGIDMPASVLTGFVAWKNTVYGLDLQGGSSVKVRSSFFGANATGVEVRTSTATASDDTAYIDLGIASSLGNNTLQSVAPSDGAASAQNTGAGLCFEILPNKSQTLSAEGNTWVNAAGTASIDCSQASPGALSETTACAAGVDFGGAGVQLVGGASINTVDVHNCTP